MTNSKSNPKSQFKKLIKQRGLCKAIIEGAIVNWPFDIHLKFEV
jgi:hypothetical protein